MEPFGERLGQPIGQRLHHDRVVIVVIAFETVPPTRRTDAGRHGERSDVIAAAAVDRRDKIGERIKCVLPFALPLLPQRVEADDFLAARIHRRTR